MEYGPYALLVTGDNLAETDESPHDTLFHLEEIDGEWRIVDLVEAPGTEDAE